MSEQSDKPECLFLVIYAYAELECSSDIIIMTFVVGIKNALINLLLQETNGKAFSIWENNLTDMNHILHYIIVFKKQNTWVFNTKYNYVAPQSYLVIFGFLSSNIQALNLLGGFKDSKHLLYLRSIVTPKHST